MLRLSLALLVPDCLACGSGSSGAGLSPTDVRFGDTAIVVVVNPVVNDANKRIVPTPGPTRAGVRLTSDDGVTATTDVSGIAVLAPVTAGTRTIAVAGSNAGGTFDVTMASGQLREIAIATIGTTAQIMANVDYKSDRVTEVLPTTSIADVNAALAVSDTVVFVRGGVYTGDINFSGSRVTLFGEGALGGQVELHGNVSVSGSDSRIRGALITGNLTMPASGVGLSFSRVNGATTSTGSDATFLSSALCGSESIGASGSLVVGNAGVAPLTQCP
jgi:hypothetical protein